jgi:dTDP-4-amino-4,6-dideoxygalactose transaminase
MVIVAPTPELRTKAVNALREARIQSSLHYPCISDFSAFQNGRSSSVPLTQQFTQRAITLPLFPTMSVDQVTHIVACLRSANG